MIIKIILILLLIALIVTVTFLYVIPAVREIIELGRMIKKATVETTERIESSWIFRLFGSKKKNSTHSI